MLPELDAEEAEGRDIDMSAPESRRGVAVIDTQVNHGLARRLRDAIARDIGKPILYAVNTHYHWDHILGMPFFGPAYDPSRQVIVYGAERFGQGAGGALAGQMVGPYFPIDIGAMRAKLDFRLIRDGSEFDIGQARVRAVELSHPGGVLAFRIESGGRSVVYATDFEHGLGKDDALVALARDADLLIYDAMYTPEEYARHKGWGHSTWVEGVRIARDAGVRSLALFHHDPSHDDKAVAAIEAAAREEFRGAFAAREGRSVVVGAPVRGAGRAAGTSRGSRAAAKAAR
jgi:phosphoribosyl 1,2-cyclic phosphodiesterase